MRGKNRDHRGDFDLFISPFVVHECSAGDPDAAREHLEVIDEIPELDVTDDANALAKELVIKVPLGVAQSRRLFAGQKRRWRDGLSRKRSNMGKGQTRQYSEFRVSSLRPREQRLRLPEPLHRKDAHPPYQNRRPAL